jgi:DNA-binding SARP family transcriptional activator/tetratricopeptide (TPR) repeat protein
LQVERLKKRGHLDIRLFGHVEVALDGAPLRLATPRKSLQVLAYLLLHRAAPVSREYLAFLLYPDDEEGAARAKLRATLSELPKILPAPADRYVIVDTDKVAWNPDADVWLDVDTFVAASADRARLGEAIELYRGDLLPEIYDEWLDVIRERHRNAYLRCLTERISEARRHANLALAIETARKVLAVDPWREDVVRRIIAMRYESGDRAGALREYTEFAKRLRDEIGAEPMVETTAVAERISRGQAPADEDGDIERPVNAAGSAVLPFVGRRDEMERLLETWSRAARGRGACAFIGGEEGIGKSRLAFEFAHAVEDRGGRVLVGVTGSPEAVPYESVVDALRSALPLVASLKPSMALACVAALLPELHARVALPDVQRLDAESERIRLLESLFRCVAELARPRPVLLILEDLHWAQAASVELLHFLLRRIVGAPVMIVVTYRDEEASRLHPLHRLRREARAAGGALNVWLTRLSIADVEELHAALPDIGDRSAETLVAASQGNPLFLSHLVVDVREGERAAPPASLQAVVERRIDRLSEYARTAAEIAACIGDRFSRDAVREVSAWDDTALTDALDELLDRRVIREAGGRGFLEYAFTHHLVYETIAHSVPPKQAAVRRRRVARVLEELYPERLSELSALLAGHYEAAGDVPNATRCYLEAVRRSVAIGALQEARAFCKSALALATDPLARANLLLESVTIESRCGDLASRDSVLLALERVDAELADPAVHRATILNRIELAASAGDPAAHEQAVRTLRASVTDDDPHWNAVLQLEEAKLALAYGRLAEAYAAGEAALAYSRGAGDDVATARALCSMAQVQAHRGPLSAADALVDEAARVAVRAADPVLELLALSSGWAISFQRRDIERCRSLSARCLELALKLGDRPAEAQAHSRLGASFAAGRGELAQAREHFAAAGRIYGEAGNPAGSGGQFMNRAVLEMRLGFFDRARTATQRAIELFERANDLRGRASALANLAFVQAYAGHVVEAREVGETALDFARRSGFRLIEAFALENLAAAEGAAGEYTRAIELAEASFEVRSRSESQVWSGQSLADVAIWHARLGNVAAARVAAQRLLADDDAISSGADWPTYCYWAAAQIFHLEGRHAEASRVLEQAKRLMQKTANELDPEDRESYLALPWHVDIKQTAASGLWPNPPR